MDYCDSHGLTTHLMRIVLFKLIHVYEGSACMAAPPRPGVDAPSLTCLTRV